MKLGTLLNGRRGSILIGALVLLVFAVPVVLGGLKLASALAIDSRVKNQILQRQYQALAGLEYGVYQLVYESGFAQGLTPGVPDVAPITVNGQTVTVTTETDTNPPSGDPGYDADNSRRFQVTELVSPSTASPNTLTTYTYTILVQNRDNIDTVLKKVLTDMPGGFSYVMGSSSGITTTDPSISGQRLTWNMAGAGLTVPAGGQASQTFQSTASVPEGIYCSESWTDPGNKKSSTGLTAKVTVGSPSSTLCTGAVLMLSKEVSPSVVASGGGSQTYTYTITLDNEGTEDLTVSRIEDLMPGGFTYVAGTTGGDITTDEPTTRDVDGRQELKWTFTPKYSVPSGQSRTLTFQATANAGTGAYWNEVWISTDEIVESTYSWPTAAVQVMSVIYVSATIDGAEAIMEVWVGEDNYYFVKKRNLKRW